MRARAGGTGGRVLNVARSGADGSVSRAPGSALSGGGVSVASLVHHRQHGHAGSLFSCLLIWPRGRRLSHGQATSAYRCFVRPFPTYSTAEPRKLLAMTTSVSPRVHVSILLMVRYTKAPSRFTCGSNDREFSYFGKKRGSHSRLWKYQ
jgi:hypothetical protein